MGYVYVSLTDKETKINKALLDHMQDGIADADNRLTSIEDRINEALYKKIVISPGSNTGYFIFGEKVKGGNILWSLSKEAQQLILTLPNGTQHTLANDQTLYEDTNEYQVTKNLTWQLYALEKDGQSTSTGTVYGSDTKYVAQWYVMYMLYWGYGTQESGFDEDFVKSLQYSTNKQSKPSAIDFPDGVEDQYLYVAMPENWYNVNYPPTFDINKDGFKDIFVIDQIEDANGDMVPNVITLNFDGAPLNYYVYRSANKLTGSKFDVGIS